MRPPPGGRELKCDADGNEKKIAVSPSVRA